MVGGLAALAFMLSLAAMLIRVWQYSRSMTMASCPPSSRSHAVLLLQSLGEKGLACLFQLTLAMLLPSATGTLQGGLAPDRLIITPNGVAFAPPSVRPGVLPRLLKEILETRIMVGEGSKLSLCQCPTKGKTCWQQVARGS